MKTVGEKWMTLLQGTHNINCTRNTMSRQNFHSPLAPLLSPVKSQGHLNKSILSGLFSKQFLGCLKDELSARKKESKPRGNQHALAVEQLHHCKRQMEAMRVRIEQLSQLNRALTKRLQLYESGPPEQENLPEPSVIVCPPKIVRHLQFTSPLGLTISQQRQGGQAGGEEVALLRERIEKLEVHKSIKEQRLNEMLEKEMRFDSELKILRIKNGELQDEVKCLRETIILQTTEKALKDTVNSDRHPDIAFSYHSNLFNFESPPIPPQQTSLSHLMPVNEGSLTASFTNNVTIPANLTLSKAELRRETPVPEEAEFNEIDYIIGEELPYLKISDELMRSRQEPLPPPPPPMNLNDSMVMIDINRL